MNFRRIFLVIVLMSLFLSLTSLCRSLASHTILHLAAFIRLVRRASALLFIISLLRPFLSAKIRGLYFIWLVFTFIAHSHTLLTEALVISYCDNCGKHTHTPTIFPRSASILLQFFFYEIWLMSNVCASSLYGSLAVVVVVHLIMRAWQNRMENWSVEGIYRIRNAALNSTTVPKWYNSTLTHKLI